MRRKRGEPAGRGAGATCESSGSNLSIATTATISHHGRLKTAQKNMKKKTRDSIVYTRVMVAYRCSISLPQYTVAVYCNIYSGILVNIWYILQYIPTSIYTSGNLDLPLQKMDLLTEKKSPFSSMALDRTSTLVACRYSCSELQANNTRSVFFCHDGACIFMPIYTA